MKKLLLLILLVLGLMGVISLYGMEDNLDSPTSSTTSDIETLDNISSSLSVIVCGHYDEKFVRTFEKILKRKARTIEQERNREKHEAIVVAVILSNK